MDALEKVLSNDLRARLLFLWERTGDEGLRRLAEGLAPRAEDPRKLDEMPPQQQSDWIGTALMDCFKDSGDAQVFAALYDRSAVSFLQAVRGKLRRCGSTVDAHDVVQEVFLNIYRYPSRFDATKADAFRNWGHRIAHNTLLKFLKRETRRTRLQTLDEDLGHRADQNARAPFRSAEEAESARVVDRAYLLYLNLYLAHYEELSEREQRALRMVEVEGHSYKQTAAALGIRLENLKMVIFRGRRKVLRGMSQSLSHLLSIREMAQVQRHVRGVRRQMAADQTHGRANTHSETSRSTSF